MRILIIGGISRSLVNFRGPLIKAMLAAGHEVIACAGEPEADVAETLKSWGVAFVPINLARAGMSPLGDLRTCLQLRRIMRQQRPDAILAYTIKPVIWGSLAARLSGIPHIFSLITGLGYAFMNKTEDERLKTEDNARFAGEPRKPGISHSCNSCNSRAKNHQCKQRLASFIAKRLYKFALRFSTKVFFQNPDDCREFIETGLVEQSKTVVVSGSGVDLQHFQTADCRPQTADSPNQEPRTKNQELKTSFLLIARLLGDKGIREYAQAAQLLKTEDRRLKTKDLPNQEPRTKNPFFCSPEATTPTPPPSPKPNSTPGSPMVHSSISAS